LITLPAHHDYSDDSPCRQGPSSRRSQHNEVMLQYTERTYRKRIRPQGFFCFQVAVKETDLWVCAGRHLETETRDLVFASRHQLETYIRSHPNFSNSLVPLKEDPYAPLIVREMIRASGKACVGPMAAVAGAIAQQVGEGLLSLTDQVIVENGGDIFLKADRPLTVSIFAGTSPLSGRFGLLIPTRQMPLGVCSSSGTIGHSLSQGMADVICLLSASAALADSAATALGNRIKKKRDLENVAEWAGQIEGILGGVVIVNDAMATWGNIELVAL
jgi:ApbE superfamily uncharacterized protein (UPF0280 family)